MWFPRYESGYNERLSPKITYALGKTILIQAGLAVLHSGLPAKNTADVFTPSLLIRSRLQLQAKHSPSDTPATVVNAVNATGGKRG